MIVVRKHTFETNSSSTHAICFGNNEDKIDPNILHTIVDTYTYYKQGCSTQYDEVNVYTTLKDKLTWLLTSMKQSGMENPFVINMKYLLEKVMPSATFEYGDPDEPYYEFEDIDWLWGEGLVNTDDPEGLPLLNEETLIKFLCEGIVVWGNRDYYNPITWDSFVNDKIDEYPEYIVKFSG